MFIKIILFLLFTNFALNIYVYYLGLGRFIINLDYILLLSTILITQPIIRQSYLFLLLTLLYGIDVILIILQIFPFIRLSDLFYLSSFILNGPVIYITSLFIVLLNLFFNFFNIRDIFLKKITLNLKKFLVVMSVVLSILFVKHLVYPLEKDHTYARLDTELFGSQL